MFHPASATRSHANRRLIALMEHLRFGQIRDLHVQDGEPVFDPAPRVIRVRQLGGDDRTPPLIVNAHRRPQVIALLAEIDALDRGVIEVIKIQDGLPVSVQVVIQDLPAA